MARHLALALSVAAVLCAAPATAQVRTVDLYAPRAFGYVLGDTIAHTVEIEIEAPYKLDPASLPQPRQLNYWLELKEVRLKEGGESGGVRRYTLDLLYQTFYAPLEPKRLEIPALALSASNGEQRAAVPVPAWSFVMSPLREIVNTAPGQPMALRPDIEPRPISTFGTRIALAATGTTALLALIALAWQLGWWPFRQRRDRPFLQAMRTVRSHIHTRASSSTASASSVTAQAAYRSALLALHRAFDATAGKGVFSEDLPRFFEAYPAFRTVEAEIRRLFAASQRFFFSGDAPGAIENLPADELLTLSRHLRSIERRG